MRASTVLRLLAGLALAAVLPLSAQNASPVADLNTDEHSLVGHPFRGLTAVQGKVFFVTSMSGSSNDDGELWVNDGTPEGTRLLVDSCPAWGCSSPVSILGSVGNVLLFTNGYDTRSRLWRSDGTRAGTSVLHPDLIVREGSFGEDQQAFYRSAFYFTGCTDEDGCDLWKTNGTAAGTVRVEDLAKDEAPFLMAVAGDRLFLAVTDGDGHTVLWRSDGTPAGTAAVEDLGEGWVTGLTPLGSRLILAFQTARDQEIWVSDGTAGGTRTLQSFQQILTSQSGIRAVGGRVYFAASEPVYGTEIWATDGTPAGTRRVTGFGPDHPSFSRIAAAGSRAVFIADDGLHGFQVWSTAGTLESTRAVSDETCQECSFVDSSTQLVEVGGRALFLAEDAEHGQEPWVTDGTPQGTHVLMDICPGSCEPVEFADALQPVPQGVLFLAMDPQHGVEMWRTDGTAAGTFRLTGIDDPAAQFLVDTSGYPRRLEAVAVGARVYFGASDGSGGTSLWAAERPAATRRLAVVGAQGPSSSPQDLLALGDRLLFVARDSQNTYLWSTQGTAESTLRLGLGTSGTLSAGETWEPTLAGGQAFLRYNTIGDASILFRTDGTPAGTAQIRFGINPGIAEWQGQLWFGTSRERHEIWKSDGTGAGTVKALELPPGSGEPGYLAGLGPELYFVTGVEDFDQSVWRTDGTQAGTRRLAGIWTDDFGVDPEFVRLGSHVFFLGSGEIWRTDGTEQGTAVLLARDDGNTSLPSDPTVFQGSLYFFAWTNGAHRALFRSDGTAAGTVPLAEFSIPYPAYVPETGLVAGGGRLWFAADDGVHGTELWTSDGTAAGTRRVRDIFPGAASSSPSSLVFAGGRLFFAADDGAHGVELWQTDGTEAGTRLVQDLAPFAASSFPGGLTAMGNRLYFAAHDGPMGRELWVLPLTGPAGCQPSAAALCLGNGRFRVEARWRDFQGNTGAGQAVSLTPDTGYFWFFDPSNVELILKVLDGRGLNGHHWVFYGALSSVEYAITVTDTQTGLTRQYVNPPGQLASVGDTRGFGPLGAHSRTGPSAAASSPLTSGRTDPAAATGSCQPSATRLCLRDGRFSVEASWKDFQGHTGQGRAVSLTGDTGYFWFFDSANVEVVLKVLDGTSLNGKHWVFYGALSNVEYTLTVTDTQTGKIKTYRNPSGRFASVADTAAF